jgi:hypothetical protein
VTQFGLDATLLRNLSMQGLPMGAASMSPGLIPEVGRSMATQVSDEAMRQQAAAVIQRSYRWLDASAPLAPQVAGLIPPLITAVQQYEAEQYAASLTGAVAVVQTAQALHGATPILPAP